MSDDLLGGNVEPPKVDWYIDEGIPGVGARPDWLNEKFKSVADLGKSYHELEKKVGGVPEQYDLSNSKFIDPEFDSIKEFLQVAREKRVPKEVVDKMVESIDRFVDEYSIDPAQELKKLGDNAQERLKTLDNWAKANLSGESYSALTSNLKSADSIKALEEIRTKMMGSNTMIPSGNEASANNIETLDQIKEEITKNLEKYKGDPKYRDDLQKRLGLAAKNSGYIDKVGA